MKRVILFLLLLAVLIFVSTSLAFWLASEEAPQLSDEQSCAVLVLGYPSKADGAVSKVARFRVEEGVKLYRALGCSKLAFSGAAVRNKHVEAESMAAFARQLTIPEKEMVIEGSARSTWENIGCTARLLPSIDRILIVSDSLHAKRAERYACRQSSDLCERFLAVGVAPPINAFWRTHAAIYEFLAFLRDSLLYKSGVGGDSPVCAYQ